MKVSDIQVVSQSEGCELRANIKFDTHWVWGDEPFPLWYRFPQEYGSFLSAENGDAFVAACLAPAMLLSEPLEITAPVSKKLVRATREIQAIYQRFNPSFTEVFVSAPVRDDNGVDEYLNSSPPQNCGLFYSLGVDSSYCLWKSIAQQEEQRVTHLINVLGFDIYLWEEERYLAVAANINKVAQQLGMQFLPVTTNLREMSDRLVDWVDIYHGAALASVGLALGRAFRQITIAASTTYDRLYPLGSHPVLDPLWSTANLSFIHDGCEAERLEKIRCISQLPIFLNTLRVCATDHMADVYNCGRCRKCLGTMISLQLFDALRRCPTLPEQIDLELVRNMELKTPGQKYAIERLIAALPSFGQDATIRTALQECLARANNESAKS